MRDSYPDKIAEIRGRGLLTGIKFTDDVSNIDVVDAARDAHLLMPRGGDNVVRLLPPLNVNMDIIDEAVVRLEQAVMSVGITTSEG